MEDCPVVVDLYELAPVSGRATSGRHRRRFERFAEVCQDLPDRPRVGDERDQSDGAAARRTFERKLRPTRASSFAQAIREVSCERGFA